MPLGEQPFVEIARLLLLDEPGQGLAPLVIRENFRAITQPKKLGVDILLVEQNALSTLQVAEYGHVLATGERSLWKGGPGTC